MLTELLAVHCNICGLYERMANRKLMLEERHMNSSFKIATGHVGDTANMSIRICWTVDKQKKLNTRKSWKNFPE